MATTEDRSGAATHEVFNQAPPLENYNVFEADRPLVEAVDARGRGLGRTTGSRELGAICGRPDTIRLGVEANENRPQLRTHDRFGNRIDEVEFHPAWHELMRIGVSHGLHAVAVARAAAGRPRRPRAAFMQLVAGRVRRRLPDLDDLLGDPGAADAARDRRGVGAALRCRSTTTSAWSRRPTRRGRCAGWG